MVKFTGSIVRDVFNGRVLRFFERHEFIHTDVATANS
jgi:hypothetical protein